MPSTAFENLKSRQAVTGQAQKASGSAFNALKQRPDAVVGAPSAAQAAAPKDGGVKGGFLGEMLTGNTQRFGKTIGEAVAAPGNADKFAQASQGHQEVQANVVKRIAEKRAAGEDTSRLEKVLADHVADAPKLEDFTGDVVNKTAGQVLGEAGGVALEVLPFGTYGKATRLMKAGELAPKLAKAPSIVEGAVNALAKPKSLLSIGTAKAAAEGAAFGYGVDVTQGLQNKEGAASFKPGLGTALGALAPVAVKGAGGAVAKIGEKRASKAAGEVDKLANAITQGDGTEVESVKRAMRQVDMAGVRTFDEGLQRLNQGIKDIKEASNKALDTNPYDIPLAELDLKTKVGGQEISHNYVVDALTQMEKHYASVNDQKALAELSQLKDKAAKSGLSVREIDALAVRHGQDLSGFNANGELSSGLSKQAAENTRKGLKATARELFGNKVYNEADSAITDIIRTRDMFEEMAVKAQKAQNRIKEMGLKDRIGSLLEKALNVGTLGTSRATMGAVARQLGTPGAKTANVLELQKALAKNIKRLDDIFAKGQPEETAIAKLEKYLEEAGFQAPKASLRLPTAKGNPAVHPPLPALRKPAKLPARPKRLK